MKEKIKQFVVDNKRKVIVSGVLVFILIICIVIYIVLSDKDEQSPFYSEAFFFKGNKEYAALFSDEGDKLTDYEFMTYESFICDKALVTNKDEEKALISDNGKIIIDYDEYDSLYRIGGVYIANDGDKTILLDCNGKKVKELENVTVYRDTSASTSFTVYDEKKVYIYNYKGKKIGELSFKSKSSILIDEYDDYSIASSGESVIIYHSLTGDIIKEFSSDENYCINGVNEIGSTFTLFNCGNSKNVISVNKNKFLIVTKEDVIDMNDKCDSIMMQYNMLNCVKDNNTVILNSKYKEAFNYYDTSLAYIDGDNYAIEKDDKLLIYKNAKIVKEIELDGYKLRTSKVEGDSYLLYKDKKYVFYDTLGKEIFSIKGDNVSPITSNKVSFVENNNKTYLIDNKGKTVTKKYDNIYSDGDYFKVKKDDKYGIIDSKDKIIIDIKYDEIIKNKIRDNIYYSLLFNKKYDVYSVNDDKVLIKNVDDVNYYDHYFVVTKDGKKIYYTYNAKKFFSE